MDVTEGKLSAKKIKAENLNIELGEPEVTSKGLLGAQPGTTPKLKIYNGATLPQKIQYWLVIGLSIGSLISYGATIIQSFNGLIATNNCTFSTLK
jgi:hypothetical protein